MDNGQINMVSLRLKTGEDIVGIFLRETANEVIVKDPLSIIIDPTHGIFAKTFLIFAETDVVVFKKKDTYFVEPSSKKAIEYYSAFMLQNETDDFSNDSESTTHNISHTYYH